MSTSQAQERAGKESLLFALTEASKKTPPPLLEAHCKHCNNPHAEHQLIGIQRGYKDKTPDLSLYHCVECPKPTTLALGSGIPLSALDQLRDSSEVPYQA